jgi:hypothetical protein
MYQSRTAEQAIIPGGPDSSGEPSPFGQKEDARADIKTVSIDLPVSCPEASFAVQPIN